MQFCLGNRSEDGNRSISKKLSSQLISLWPPCRDAGWRLASVAEGVTLRRESGVGYTIQYNIY